MNYQKFFFFFYGTLVFHCVTLTRFRVFSLWGWYSRCMLPCDHIIFELINYWHYL